MTWFENRWYIAILILLAVGVATLPKIRDGILVLRSLLRKKKRVTSEFTSDGEVARFEDKLRSRDYNVIKIHCVSHIVGVMAEHYWLDQVYPDCTEERIQSITRLDIVTKEKTAQRVWFDKFEFKGADGRLKAVYFDISDFFTGKGTSFTNPMGFMRETLKELYKDA